jgi:tetratricopeptide (TPR) repeat protein
MWYLARIQRGISTLKGMLSKARRKSLNLLVAHLAAGVLLLPYSAMAGSAEDRQTCEKSSGDTAIAACTRAIKSGRFKGHELADLHLNRGVEVLRNNELDRAMNDYDLAIKHNPKFSLSYNNRANLWSDKGALDRAMADYNEAIRLDPKYAIAFNGRGNLWRSKGDLDHAITDYSEAVRVDPTYATAFQNRGYALAQKGNNDQAIADYDEAIRLDPANAWSFHSRGLPWRAKGGLRQALADYNEAIRLDPNFADAFASRGDLHRDQGNRDRAVSDYDETTRLDPGNAAAFDSRGNVYWDKGDYERAMADFNEAIRLDPSFAAAYADRAFIWYKRHDFDRAIAAYSEAVRVDPKYAPAFASRGNVHREWGDLDRAMADYADAIRLDPKNGAFFHERAIAWREKGDLDRAMSDYRQAIQLYDEAISHDPNNPLVWTNRCGAKAESGQLQAALADCDEAIRLQRENPDAMDNRGFVYLKLKEFDRAIAAHDQALRLNPKHASALYGRGLAKRYSNIPDGNSDLAAALEIDPKTKRQYARLGLLPPDTTTATPPAAGPGVSDRRLALVIGNSSYLTFPKLSNPRNDARDISQMLGTLGFDVLTGTDLKRQQMEEMLIRFAREASNTDTALVFYAGHGLQHNGINYLVPVDAGIEDEADLRKLINMQGVVNDLQNAGRVRILIVDACRDNSVVTQLASRLPATRSASVSRGLARIESADGTLVAFATQPNRVAADGERRNSPSARALLDHLATPGLELRTMLTRVRAQVVNSTGGSQRPEVWDSLVGEFTFKQLQ